MLSTLQLGVYTKQLIIITPSHPDPYWPTSRTRLFKSLSALGQATHWQEAMLLLEDLKQQGGKSFISKDFFQKFLDVHQMGFISVTTVSDETFTVRIRNVSYFMYLCKCFQICVSATVPIDLEASNMTWSPPTLHLSLQLKVSWEVVFSMSYLSIVQYFKSTSMIWFCFRNSSPCPNSKAINALERAEEWRAALMFVSLMKDQPQHPNIIT